MNRNSEELKSSAEVNEDFVTQISELIKELQERAEIIFGNSWQTWYEKKLFLFGKKVRESELNPFNFEVWHILIGSSRKGDNKRAFAEDLPSPYSVEVFLTESIEKLKGLPPLDPLQKRIRKRVDSTVTIEKDQRQMVFELRIIILRERLKALFRKIFGEKEWKKYFINDISAFFDDCKEASIDPAKYVACLLLREEESTNSEKAMWDMPEPYSVQSFLRNTLQELKKIRHQQDPSEEDISE